MDGASIADGAPVADGVPIGAEVDKGALGAPSAASEAIVGLLAELLELRECFDSKIRYDQAKERQIEALHEELQAHRQGLYQQIMEPVLIDLIDIHDEMAGQLAAADGTAPDGLGFLAEMVEGVLSRYGVTRFSCAGDAIDRSRQRVIDTEATGEAALGKRLARRLRPGFEIKGKVIRPEWVVAYRHVPGTGTSA